MRYHFKENFGGDVMALPTGIEAKAFETVASNVISKASPKIMDAIAKRLSLETIRLRIQFTKTFQEHLARTLEKSSRIKTVISRDKPVDLEGIYVELSLECDNQRGLPEATIDPCARSGARTIISGTGGAGKTVLMKHLLNMSVKNGRNIIPIFIELRNIQFDKGKSLEECIFDELQDFGEKESFKMFKVALEEGIFAIYLDGFDEIHPEEHAKALRYIKRFSECYPECSILISTRPKTGALTLLNFTVYHVEPLSKDQAIGLIEKTEFDNITKEKFLNSLKEGLYDKHKTLMSLPILVAMMLLAYRTYADIPDRMTVFYGQAFETLYSIHDAENKELFKRNHHAGLAPDVFKSVLQSFCYLSLSNHDIEFTESTLNSYIARALAVSKVDVSPEKYKNDIIHNVCIIQPDGLNYVFVHRSFQEYFAAQFAIKYSGDRKFDIFDQIVDVSGSAVARMMLEIDPIKTRRNWLLPKAQQFSRYLAGVSRRKTSNQITAFFNNVWISHEDNHPSRSFTLGVEGGSTYRIMELLADCTGGNFGWSRIASSFPDFDENWLNKNISPIVGFVDKARMSRGDSGVIFDGLRLYQFSSFNSSQLGSIGITSVIKSYRRDLEKCIAELLEDVSAHAKLEDHELFE